MLLRSSYTSRPSPVRPLDPTTDKRWFSIWWARREAAANNTPILTPTQLMTGGPSVSAAGSGTAPLLKTVAGGADVAHYLPDGVDDCWIAPAKADWDFLHKLIAGSATSAVGPWTFKSLVWIPTTAALGTIWDTCNLTGNPAGACCYYDPNSAGYVVDAFITTTSAPSPLELIASYTDNHIIIPGRWTIVTIEYCYGRRGHETRGWIHGLPAYHGDGFFRAASMPTTSSTGFMHFFSTTLGAYFASFKVAFIGFAKQILSRADHLAVDKFITDTEGISPVGTVVAEDRAYAYCPGMITLPNGTRKLWYLEVKTHTDWSTRRSVEVCSVDNGITWTPPRTIGTQTALPASPVYPVLIGNVLWDSGGADISDPAYVRSSTDYGETWSARTLLDAFGGAGTYIEGNIVVAPNGDYLVGVYGGTTTTKIMASTNAGVSWAIRATLAGGGGECCLARIAGTSTVVAYYHDYGANNICWVKSTDNGATWTVSAIIFAGETRPTVLQLASGAIVMGYRTTVENKRNVIRYLSPANVTAGNFGAFGGACYYGPVAGFAIYTHMLEDTPGNIFVAGARETGAIGESYCEIVTTWLTEALLATF